MLFWHIPFPTELDIINDKNINKYFELSENETNKINKIISLVQQSPNKKGYCQVAHLFYFDYILQVIN